MLFSFSVRVADTIIQTTIESKIRSEITRIVNTELESNGRRLQTGNKPVLTSVVFLQFEEQGCAQLIRCYDITTELTFQNEVGDETAFQQRISNALSQGQSEGAFFTNLEGFFAEDTSDTPSNSPSNLPTLVLPTLVPSSSVIPSNIPSVIPSSTLCGYVVASSCESEWSQNFFGIELSVYNDFRELFVTGSTIVAGGETYFVDAIQHHSNCNSNVGLVYVANQVECADGRAFVYTEECGFGGTLTYPLTTSDGWCLYY
eukprot:CAMPEP_0195508868 /NCGR_PEP_ID=MMETSP0794_2-20130614/1966_1 /TAXON_ID=515487 /ORGANISM="Stephanopyxis turris, Strain CCMP 815" /LENGTH=258 /DNA_ID=CAMNT_0040635949 /DNA_START=1382 /DNA_END=2158 /DNA_ORIENTATION=-